MRNSGQKGRTRQNEGMYNHLGFAGSVIEDPWYVVEYQGHTFGKRGSLYPEHFEWAVLHTASITPAGLDLYLLLKQPQVRLHQAGVIQTWQYNGLRRSWTEIRRQAFEG